MLGVFFTDLCKTEALCPWATNRDKDEIVWAAVQDTRRREEEGYSKDPNRSGLDFSVLWSVRSDERQTVFYCGWFNLGSIYVPLDIKSFIKIGQYPLNT